MNSIKKNRLVKLTLILTVGVELLCILFRYGFGLKAGSSTASTIGVVTQGIRIHHSYIGIFLLVLYPWIRKCLNKYKIFYLAFGLALVLSDAIHHFAVLWPIEGSPEFDLFYDYASPDKQ